LLIAVFLHGVASIVLREFWINTTLNSGAGEVKFDSGGEICGGAAKSKANERYDGGVRSRLPKTPGTLND
jgi:hypothetical protein